MIIADLQNMLATICQLLNSAGGKGEAELRELSDTLTPLRDMTAKQFANELKKITDPKPSPVKPPKSVGAPSVNADQVIEKVRALYERAASLTAQDLSQNAGILSDLKKKADLVRAAAAIGLVGMNSKAIPEISKLIMRRITDRMGAAQKAGMIDVVGGA